jgi:hypothetical protein
MLGFILQPNLQTKPNIQLASGVGRVRSKFIGKLRGYLA